MNNACIFLLTALAIGGAFLTPSGAEDLVESSPKSAAVAASPAPADELAELRRLVREKDMEIERLGSDLALSRKEVELLERERDVLHEELGFRDPKIVWVNPEWNFVLVDHGGLPMVPGLRAFVNRGSNFVGAITITHVHKTVSIAEINPADQVPGLTIQAGDDMFFPPRADAGSVPGSGDRKAAR